MKNKDDDTRESRTDERPHWHVFVAKIGMAFIFGALFIMLLNAVSSSFRNFFLNLP